MKKAVITLLIVLIIFVSGCSSTKEMNNSNFKTTKTNEEGVKMTEKKEITLKLSTSIMKGDWNKVEELLDDNFVYIGDGNPPINKQQYIGFMKNVLCTAMTEMDMKFLRVIEEGDLVAVEYTNEMTNSGSFYGIPATGKRVMGTGMFIREVKNGKITAEWQTTNAMGLINQLQAK